MPAETRFIRLTVPADYHELPLVRHVIRHTLPALPDPMESLYLGAVTEILVNAIDACPDGLVSVTIATHPERAVIVSDNGPGFDPAQSRSTKPNSLGQGLTIARAVVSGLEIADSDGGGTTVTLPYPQTVESPS